MSDKGVYLTTVWLPFFFRFARDASLQLCYWAKETNANVFGSCVKQNWQSQNVSVFFGHSTNAVLGASVGEPFDTGSRIMSGLGHSASPWLQNGDELPKLVTSTRLN